MQGLSKNQVKYILRLNKNSYFRRQEQKTFIEGQKVVLELLKEIPDIVEYYVVRSGFEKEAKRYLPSNKTYVVPDALGYKLTTHTKFNVGALIKMPEIKLAPKSLKGLVFGLVGIQDPGNLGTIFRTLLAFDIKDIILFNHCASPYHQKSVSASSGAVFRLNLYKYEEVEDFLNNLDLPVYALDIKANKSYKDIETKKGLFLFGNEGRGLTKKTLEQSTEVIKIPIKNIDSLNVAVSVGIVASHFSPINQ